MAGYTCTGRYRDLRRCLKSLNSFTDGQARILDWDPDNLEFVRLQLAPKDGPYKGGQFNFEIRLHEGYPDEAPFVTCLTNVYHPNIKPYYEYGEVCLNLFTEWEYTFGLEDVVQGLLFLFYNPNHEDALTGNYKREEQEEAEFNENVQKSLLQEDVDDFTPTIWEPITLDVPLPTELKDAKQHLQLVENCVGEREKAGLIGDTVDEDEARERMAIEHDKGEEQNQNETQEQKTPNEGIHDAREPLPSEASPLLDITQSVGEVEDLPNSRSDIYRNDSLLEYTKEMEASGVMVAALALEVTPSEVDGEGLSVITVHGDNGTEDSSKVDSENTKASVAITFCQVSEMSSREAVGQMIVLPKDDLDICDCIRVVGWDSRNGGNEDSSATSHFDTNNDNDNHRQRPFVEQGGRQVRHQARKPIPAWFGAMYRKICNYCRRWHTQ